MTDKEIFLMIDKEIFLRTIRQWLGTKLRYAATVLKIQEILLKNNKKYFSKNMFDELKRLPGVSINYTGNNLDFSVEGDPIQYTVVLKAALPEGAETINAHAIVKYNFTIFNTELRQQHAQWEKLLLDFEWQEQLVQSLIEYEKTRKAMIEEINQTGLDPIAVARIVSSGLEHFFHEDLAYRLKKEQQEQEKKQ